MTKRAKLTHEAGEEESSDSRPKFNLPCALLCDPRCSPQLAQYAFAFLDTADVVFGINSLQHTIRDYHSLIDDNWWKRRLTAEFGSSVTRFSNATLQPPQLAGTSTNMEQRSH